MPSTPQPIHDVLKSLVLWIETRAGLQPVAGVAKLFAHVAYEDPAKVFETYSVLRTFGGPAQRTDPIRDAQVQCFTTGKTAADAAAQAEAVYQALLDDEGVPVIHAILDDHFELGGVLSLTPPGRIGMDTNKRHLVAFNFRIAYRRR